jgi:alpha-beta hydrolase superfamily lysophospholipase
MQASRFFARILTVAGVLTTLILAPAVAAKPAQPAVSLDGVSADAIRKAKPGHIFRIRPQVGGALNGAAFRVIYRSTDLNGEPVAVSGTIIYPEGAAPKGGRNVVAWAHYTTGVSQRCAPTLLPNLGGTIPGLEEMLARGFVVVATDYEGLGVPGVHAYLVGISEAHAVLDSVRAARNLSAAHASNRFAVWGHSQGGHAALFTRELAGAYAPELKLVGVAAAAPATDLVELFKAQQGSVAGEGLTSMALLSWSRTYNLPIDTVLEASVEKRFEQVGASCIQSVPQMLRLLKLAWPLKKAFLKTDPTKLPAWRDLMEKNSPSAAASGVPVFISQGTGDKTVNANITIAYAKALCANGTRVALQIMKGASHSFAAEKSAYKAVKWILDRFRGKTAPSNCRG